MTCECGHLIVCHDLRRDKTRGACSHQDPSGPCPCRAAREMVSGSRPLALPEVGDERG